MAEKKTTTTKVGAAKPGAPAKAAAPGTSSAGKADRSLKPSLFGIGSADVSAKNVDRHVAEIAKGLGTEIAALARSGRARPLDLGIASTLHGLWINDGQGSRPYDTNILNTDQLSSVISLRHEQGWAPIDIVGSFGLFDPWTVAYAPRPAGYFWVAGLDEAGFVRQNDDLREAGFRIVSFNRRHGLFNATWRAVDSPGGEIYGWDMSFIALRAWAERRRQDGFRIVAIDRYGDGGNSYAAVWQPGDGEQIIEAPGGLNVYFGQPDKFLFDKYQNRGLEIRAMGHNGYPIAVYRPKKDFDPFGEQRWTYTIPSDFKSADDIYRSQGYRLSFISHAHWQFG